VSRGKWPVRRRSSLAQKYTIFVYHVNVIGQELVNPHLQSAPDMARTRSRAAARKPEETVGDRLRRFRKLKGLTQTELGDEIGISQRVITYYETEGGTLSPELLVKFAEALEVSTDAILGLEKSGRRDEAAKPQSLALWRRFHRIQKLPPHDRKTILRMIDALAERTSK
jgi:transcriptional regulator with XRE-family HTH domain